MKKQGCLLLIIVLTILLSACISTVWTGATLIYDRHSVYVQLNDYKLAVNAGRALVKDNRFSQPGCVLEIAVFHDDILLAGHVPTPELREQALAIVNSIDGVRKVYNQIAVISDAKSEGMTDGWITAKIRTRIFADSSIAPKDFKIVTVDNIVYIMGEGHEDQAQRVIDIARSTQGVRRVVKLFHVLSALKTPLIPSEKAIV